MHWVRATAPDGRDCYVNLDAVQTMMEVRDGTMLFLGGICTTAEGKIQHSITSVRESVAELLARPKMEPSRARAAAPPEAMPDAATAQVVNAVLNKARTKAQQPPRRRK